MLHVNGLVLFISVLRNVYSRGEGVGQLLYLMVGRSAFMRVSKMA